MKRIFIFFFAFLLRMSAVAQIQSSTEGQFIGNLVTCLQKEDGEMYNGLFPSADSVAIWVLNNTASTSDTFAQMDVLLNNPMEMMSTDSMMKRQQKMEFSDFLSKGKMQDIHWDQIVSVRYELEKLKQQVGVLNMKIAPNRFLGYVFIKDMLTRKTYAFTILDIKQVKGNWYGGELLEIFEASSKEEYATAWEKEKKHRMEMKESREKNRKARGTTDNDDDDDKPYVRKEVMDRKFYKGKFDNEISVELYVRYLKGGCPEVVCSWEALFKFGDQDEYVKMEVSKTADGKWSFLEELGGMDLKLEGKIYTGTWASGQDKTEYAAYFGEANVSTKKIAMLDEMLDKGIHGE